MRLRRTPYVFFAPGDGGMEDLRRLLSAVVELPDGPWLQAVSALTGDAAPIRAEAVRVIAGMPDPDWVEVDDLAASSGVSRVEIEALAHIGALVSDSEVEPLSTFRARDDALHDSDWNTYAALFQAVLSWKGQRIMPWPVSPPELESVYELAPDIYTGMRKVYGDPPPEFHRRDDALAVVVLPDAKRDGGLYDALERRRTIRSQEAARALDLADLATLLFYAWGPRGHAAIGEGVRGVHKCVPSGGGLHPGEVYPVVVNVEGLASGIYHYAPDRHALELLTELPRHEASELLDEATAFQGYPRWSNVGLLLTARFARDTWKYRRDPRSYLGALLDAGHISQTVYLVAAELGLGCYVTGAINGRDIEQRLGLDGVREGAVLVMGLGHVRDDGVMLDPVFEPYEPAP